MAVGIGVMEQKPAQQGRPLGTGYISGTWILRFHLYFSFSYSFTEVDINFSIPAIWVLYSAIASLFFK